MPAKTRTKPKPTGKSATPAKRTVLPESTELARVYEWSDRNGRVVQASVKLIQEVLTPAGERPFSFPECFMLLANCMSRGYNPFTRHMMLVRYAKDGPAQLVCSRPILFAEAQAAGGADYQPPEVYIKLDEKGRPLYGWGRCKRRSWPESDYVYYPAKGNVILFKDMARKKRDGSIGATWADPGMAEHMMALTIKARLFREVWAEACHGLYLVEEFGMPGDRPEEGPEPPKYEAPPKAPTPPAPPELPASPAPAQEAPAEEAAQGEDVTPEAQAAEAEEPGEDPVAGLTAELIRCFTSPEGELDEAAGKAWLMHHYGTDCKVPSVMQAGDVADALEKLEKVEAGALVGWQKPGAEEAKPQVGANGNGQFDLTQQ